MYHPHRQNLHFIGIGGVGMAGIAEVLLNLGYSVSGSDLKKTALTEHLEELGAKICYSHAPENVPESTTVVVVSSAIVPSNPELLAAQEKGLPILPRAEMLGELMRMKYGVAVAGAHGKTTTTTMIGHILERGALDPTVIIGGRVLSRPSGARLGTGKFLVAEADESDGSFVSLRPAIAVVTNIDREHLSHYGTFGKLEEAFQQFMSAVPFYGLLVACADDTVVRSLAAKAKRRTLLYGFTPDSLLSACDVVVESGRTAYTLVYEGKEAGRYFLPMPGRHMISNALAACAVGIELGLGLSEVALSLQDYPGVARRSEVVARSKGVTVIDDYGHHPTEIEVTLEGLRNSYLKDGRMIVLFQPHRYSRTQELFSQFLTCFRSADELVVGEIYGAGEERIPGVTGESLARAIQHEKVQFASDLPAAAESLVARLRSGDVVVTLGAGNVSQISRQLASKLQ